MNDCDSEHPLQGRIRPLEGKNIYLFGSLASAPADPSTYFAPTRAVGYWQPQGKVGCGCGCWMIQASTVEVLRSASEVVIAPLGNVSQVIGPNTALPVGAVRARGRSQLKLQVTAEASTTARTFFMDVGQTIELNADCIGIQYLAPDNFVEISGGQNLSVLRSGLVADVYTSVSLNRIEQSVGATEAIFTTNLFVTANTLLSVPVPPFAREVTIYQNSLGASSVQWTQWYGDPITVAGSIEAASLPWIAGLRRTQQETLIPDVTHLRTDADANADRFFTLRWVIRP